MNNLKVTLVCYRCSLFPSIWLWIFFWYMDILEGFCFRFPWISVSAYCC